MRGIYTADTFKNAEALRSRYGSDFGFGFLRMADDESHEVTVTPSTFIFGDIRIER